jgi:FkbM family methyltransferase
MGDIIKSRLKKLLVFFNFTFRIKLNDKKFKIPILGGLGIANRSISEQWMIDLLKMLLPIAGSKFIDVGVNIGQTLLAVKCIDEEIKYIGFEPNPSCIHYVKKLIKTNLFKNTVLVPIGISTRSNLGELNFYSENDDESSATMVADFREKKIIRKELVPQFRVENIKDQINFKDMSILKIDVEGAELKVVESFKTEIKNYYPFILMEILPVYNELENPKRLQNQIRLQNILGEMSYSIFLIIKNNNELIELRKISRIGIHSNINNCDYLFVPENRLHQLETIANIVLKY